MKKLMLGSAVLTLFAISVTLFQISCQKESQAQTTTYTLPAATTTTLGGVIVGNGLSVTANGTLSVNSTPGGVAQQNKILFTKGFVTGMTEWSELWTANYNGTNPQKINITLPANHMLQGEIGPVISPDRQTIFITLQDTNTGIDHLYSCKIDGSNLQKIIDGIGTTGITTGSAY